MTNSGSPVVRVFGAALANADPAILFLRLESWTLCETRFRFPLDNCCPLCRVAVWPNANVTVHAIAIGWSLVSQEWGVYAMLLLHCSTVPCRAMVFFFRLMNVWAELSATVCVFVYIFNIRVIVASAAYLVSTSTGQHNSFLTFAPSYYGTFSVCSRYIATSLQSLTCLT